MTTPVNSIPIPPPEGPESPEPEQETEEKQSKEAWDVDPANPRNWSQKRKWKNVAIVSLYTFIAPLASSMMAPGLAAIGDHYNIRNPSLIALSLSIYLLAFALGPLLIAPLSEIYGRTWVLHISNFVFVAFTFGCIFAPNSGALIIFRFLSGIGGSTPVSTGGGSVSDLFDVNERSTAMSVYSMGPLVGPVLGPIAGGFIVKTIGFKWIFIVLTIVGAVGSLIAIPLLEETYAPVIKARLANIRTADVETASGTDVEVPVKPSLTETLRLNMARPFMLFTHSLICFILSLYMALIYGYLYLMFTTFPMLFSEVYGWGPGVSGLAYLGPGIGFFTATAVGSSLLSKIYVKLSAGSGGKGKPEYRIPLMILGSFFVPIGLFWYGWSAEAHIHWIMPIIGAGIFSGGMMFVYLPIQLYLVDAFTYAASALAAASVLRALFGFVFPLFGEDMFATLGFGGGNSLLGGLAIVTGIPFPIFLYFRGEEMRLRNPLNR
ncbi:MFS general substrate transporter [Hysterangium stoloniferum]|nr:MFS general substrate transporter [Hysterangium stoloniferum]